jgi:hypothetical protein
LVEYADGYIFDEGTDDLFVLSLIQVTEGVVADVLMNLDKKKGPGPEEISQVSTDFYF